MGFLKFFTLACLTLMGAAPALAQNSCGGSLDQSEQFKRQLYRAANHSCEPGIEVKYQTVSKTLPYFELNYTKDGRAIPMVCHPAAFDCGCMSMLQDGESFKVSDLQHAVEPKDGDTNHFMERVEKIFHGFVKVTGKALQYGGIAVPLGDGASAFLSDMGDRLDDRANEKDKAREAAEQLRKIFVSLLSCKDEIHAPYKKGTAVEEAVIGFFIDLSQDKKIDMGDNAVSNLDYSKLFELIAKTRSKPVETTMSKIEGKITDPALSSREVKPGEMPGLAPATGGSGSPASAAAPR